MAFDTRRLCSIWLIELIAYFSANEFMNGATYTPKLKRKRQTNPRSKNETTPKVRSVIVIPNEEEPQEMKEDGGDLDLRIGEKLEEKDAA